MSNKLGKFVHLFDALQMFLARSLVKPILYREAVREEHGLDSDKVIYCCCSIAVPFARDRGADDFECSPMATSNKLDGSQRARSQSLVMRASSSNQTTYKANVVDRKRTDIALLSCLLVVLAGVVQLHV